MAYDKIADCTQLDAALTATANAIRSKTGGTTSLSWNASTGFADAVNSITSVKNQTKTGISPTETTQTITYDNGYTGLNSVQINAISPTYVGSSVLRKAAQTYTPTTTNQTIASGQYLTGTQTIAGSANLVAGNIKSGVTLFGVTGNYGSMSVITGSVAFQLNFSGGLTRSAKSSHNQEFYTLTDPEEFNYVGIYSVEITNYTTSVALQIHKYVKTSINGKAVLQLELINISDATIPSSVINTFTGIVHYKVYK